jgi:hypothetical protein
VKDSERVFASADLGEYRDAICEPPISVQLSCGAYRHLAYAQERIRRTLLGDRRPHGRLTPIALRLRVGLALQQQGIFGRFEHLREAKVRQRIFEAAEDASAGGQKRATWTANPPSAPAVPSTAAIPPSRNNPM